MTLKWDYCVRSVCNAAYLSSDDVQPGDVVEAQIVDVTKSGMEVRLGSRHGELVVDSVLTEVENLVSREEVRQLPGSRVRPFLSSLRYQPEDAREGFQNKRIITLPGKIVRF